MVVTPVRERYRVDLLQLQTTCDANYLRLLRLLPHMREQPQNRRIAISQGDLMLGIVHLEVTECGPYTSSVRVRQEHHLPWLPVPQLDVRVYHDARMAEVVGSVHTRRLQIRYGYPNAAMHQPDEKRQLNLFLGEWLSHCLARGHEAYAVV